MANRFRNWIRNTFRSSSQPRPQTLAPGVALGHLPSLEQAPLLNSRDVHHLLMSVSQNYAIDPQLSQLVDDSLEYDALFQDNQIPSKDDPDFVKKTAAMNQKLMATNEKMLVAFMDASAEYFKKWSTEKDKKNGDPALAKRYEDMGACLKKMAENMQAQKIKLTNLYDQTMETYRSDPNKLTAMQGKSYADIYALQTPYQKAENTGKKLGQGAMNTVYKVEVDGKERVFKEGHVNLRDMKANDAIFFERTVGVEKTTLEYGDKSMQILKDVNTAQRDVAMSRVDKLLGLGIVVDTKLVRSESGELSSLMDFANGFSVESRDYAINDAEKDLIQAYQRVEYPKQIEKNRNSIEDFKSRMAATPEFANDLQEPLDEVVSLTRNLDSKQNNAVISVREQSLNKSLMDLAALDYVCSHVDRHVGNYIIENTDGKFRVHAIDNDTAFKNKELDTPGARLKPVVDLEANFPFVTADLKKKMDSISPDMLRNSLEGLLSKEQIDISCQRLKAIQEHFRKIPVVEGDFTEAQLDQLLDQQHAQKSYNAHLAYHAHSLRDSENFQEWKKTADLQTQASAKPPTQAMDYNGLVKESVQAGEQRKSRLSSSVSKKAAHDMSMKSDAVDEKKKADPVKSKADGRKKSLAGKK